MKTIHENIGYDIITSLISEGSRVLDLGCGDGELLHRLRQAKKATGYGVEISEEGVSRCVEKGLYCYQADIDEGLNDYRSNSFDYVILNQTIQSTKRPDYVVQEILRISKKAIISFPNFAHLSVRCQFFTRGTMPKTPMIPYNWYNSPNIHMVTITDFKTYCRVNNYPVERELHFSISSGGKTKIKRNLSNLFAQYGLFLLDGKPFTD